MLLKYPLYVLLGFAGMTAIDAGAWAAELHISQDKNAVSVCRGAQPILRYRFADVPMKPYVDQLFSPAGVQVLRDSPHDHKHHHGLMFALAVDNIDFWGEFNARCGRQKNISPPEVKSPGRGRAEFAQTLEWIDPTSDRPLLVERRTIAVLTADDLGATLVEWRSRLQPPPGKDSAAITGHHYYGLGLRMVESMDKGGRFFNAAGRAGEVVRGDERLVPAKWCAYAAQADGRPVTVALFDHPANLRHPARIFSMSVPFAYLSATLNEWKEPITVRAGEPLDLRYGVALWDGEADKAAIEKSYRRWLDLSPP